MSLVKKLGLFVIIALLSSCQAEESFNETQTEADFSSVTALTPTIDNITLAEAVLIEVNHYRAENGLSAIVLDNGTANKLALEHTSYMIYKNEPSHDNFYSRSESLVETGAVAVSENVAYGYSHAASIVNAWVNSPSHKAVLDGDFNYVGIGILTSDDDTNYCTALFYKK